MTTSSSIISITSSLSFLIFGATFYLIYRSLTCSYQRNYVPCTSSCDTCPYPESVGLAGAAVLVLSADFCDPHIGFYRNTVQYSNSQPCSLVRDMRVRPALGSERRSVRTVTSTILFYLRLIATHFGIACSCSFGFWVKEYFRRAGFLVAP